MTPILGRVTGHRVMVAVCDDTGLPLIALTGKTRKRRIARARQVAAHLMRRLCPHLSYPAIGRLLGGRDHTTILHADRKISEMIQTDPEVAAQVARIEARLTALRPATPMEVTIPFSVLCAGYAAAMAA